MSDPAVTGDWDRVDDLAVMLLLNGWEPLPWQIGLMRTLVASHPELRS